MKLSSLNQKFLTGLLLITPLLASAAAVTRTWNGGTDGNWGTAANWTPSGVPASGSPYDSVFFNGTSRLTTTNNLSSQSVSNLTFAAGGFTVNGNALIIRNSITNLAGVNVINVPVTLASNPKNWDVVAGSEIVLAGGSGTATFTGNPPFEKFDAGNVRFQNVNLWAQGADIAGGAAIIDGGSLTITNDGFRLIAANGAWAGLIVTNGGTLTLGANSIGKNFNLKLGSTGLLTGTNELDLSSGQIFLGQNISQFIVGDQSGAIGVVNQNGGAILYQNNNVTNDLLIANLAGAIGTYNLNGGLLQVPLIKGGAKGGTSYFNFNGGTLTPYTAVNANNFIQGLTAAKVLNGGAIIDTTNINVTITQPLLNGGSGGLTKLGVGTLTLSGANTYTGTNFVNAGEFIVPNIQTGGGVFKVADNAALGVAVAATGTSLNTAGLVLGTGTGVTNEYFLGATGNPTSPVITANSLTVNGSVVVNVYGAGFSIGQFSLIKYVTASGVNAGSFHLNILPGGVAAYISNNVANSSVDLVITAAPTIVWTGAVNGAWDIGSSQNWYDPIGLQAVTYSDGSSVRFDDTATGSTVVSLATTVAPGGVTLNNNSLSYTFTGAGGIGGAGAFTKSGSGTVIVDTPNTYTGNTTISGGTLQLGVTQAIPGGPNVGNVTVNGELDLAGNSQTINGLNGGGVIDSSTGSGTLTVGSNNASGTFTGSITNTGGILALVKAGAGTETLTANNGFSGGTTLSGGRLQVGAGNSLGSGALSFSVPLAGATLASYAGGITVTNPIYVFGGSGYPAYFDTTAGDISLAGALTATGPDIFKKGYNNLSITSAGSGYSSGGVLHLYQGAFVVDGGSWTNLSNGIRYYASGSDTVRLAITNGGTLAVGFGGTGTYNINLGYSGGLTGTNELDISSGQLVFGSAFRQIIAGNAAGTYGVVNQTGGTVWFQAVTNSSVGVILGNNTGTTGWYYLNGGNLITPRVIGGSGSGYFVFNGGTLTPATGLAAGQFVSGFTAAYVGDGGAVIDTTNFNVTVSQALLNGGAGGLTKLGTGTLTLKGTNTYVGATVVGNGELWLPTVQANGTAITVADGAALGVNLSATGTTLTTPSLTLGNSTGATNEYNLGAFANPTSPLVYATNLIVHGTIAVTVKATQLSLGQFPLIKYGSASGLTGTSFQLATLAANLAGYLSNNVANSSIDLVVIPEPTLLWTGVNGSAWDISTTTNWLNAGSLLPAAYADGAFVRLDDTASGTTSISLIANIAPGGIWVSNNSLAYNLSGAGIGGLGGFTKDGAGTVVVSTPNTYTSNTVIIAGIFQLGASQVIPAGTGAGNVTVNGELDLSGYSETLNGLNGSGLIDSSIGTGALTVGSNNVAGIFTGVITNSGGILSLSKIGTNTQVLTGNNAYAGGTVLNAGILQIGNSNALGSGSVILSVPVNGVTLGTYAGSVSLTNALVATGGTDYPANLDTTAGDLVLNGSINAANIDFVKLGTNNLRITSPGPNVLNSGKWQVYGGDVIFDGTSWTNYGGAIRTFAPSGGIVHLAITNGASLTIGTVGATPNLRLGYTGGLAGTNQVDISSGQLVLDQTFVQIFDGDAAGTYGVVNQTGGLVLFQNNSSTSAGVTLGSSAGSTGSYYLNGGQLITPRIVGGSGTGYFYFNGGTVIPSSTVSATSFIGGVTAVYVGDGGAKFDTTNIDITVGQPLLNGGAGGLTKLGSAALILSGTNTYAGRTVASNGTLVVNGSLGTNAVIVAGAALVGTGIINGPVTINTNATLILGSNDPFNTGTLTVSNNVTLAGDLFAKVNKSLVQSNDVVAVSGTLVNTGNGIVTISNAGPSLVVGDVFQLFSEPVVNGGRLSIASTPGTGLAWQNNLAVNGTVTVITPPVITVNVLATSVVGNQLTIQWPVGYTGWILEAQTNSLTGNNWVPVAGSGSVNQVTVAIDPAKGSVFYRLVPTAP